MRDTPISGQAIVGAARGSAVLPHGVASVVREGSDVTIVATQQMRHRSVEAAEALAAVGIAAEVIDPRTLVPLDDDAAARSLAKTSRLLVVQESPQDGSWGASLVSRMTTQHFTLMDAPPSLLFSPDSPLPYAGVLEEAWLPSVDAIVAKAKELVAFPLKRVDRSNKDERRPQWGIGARLCCC